MDIPVLADQQKFTYIKYLYALIGTDGERESKESMLLAWLDDDD